MESEERSQDEFEQDESNKEMILEIFYKTCTENLGLNIIGLMCLPPKNMIDNKYFELMNKSSNNLNLRNLSMGMSSDYLSAYRSGATYLRIGSKIFGERA